MTAAIITSLALLALNAFFTATEFAMVAAKRHRLAELAGRRVRGAASALSGQRELALTLTGTQLGITLCSLGIGAVAEPLLEHAFEPLLTLLHAPHAVAYPVSFVVGLIVVTFCHMVIGEMVPKSLVITRPEVAAVLVSPAFRMLTIGLRPLLEALNALTDRVLRGFGVHSAGSLRRRSDPEQLRLLIAESGRMGLIEPTERTLLTRALDTHATAIGRLMVRREDVAMVAASAGTATIQEAARRSGHHRLLVYGADVDDVIGAVHVREAVVADAASRALTAGQAATPVPRIALDAGVPDAIEALRRYRTTFAAVQDGDHLIGIVSLHDLLVALLGGVPAARGTAARAGRR